MTYELNRAKDREACRKGGRYTWIMPTANNKTCNATGGGPPGFGFLLDNSYIVVLRHAIFKTNLHLSSSVNFCKPFLVTARSNL